MSRWKRGWKKFLAAAVLCAAVAAVTPGMQLPAEAATAAADGVNVRNEPSSEGDNIIGSLSEGDEVTVLRSEDADDGYTWYYVQLDNGNTGWVRSDLISADDSEISSGSDSSGSGDSQEDQNGGAQVQQQDTQTPAGDAAQTAGTSSSQEAAAAAATGETAVSAAASLDPTTDPNSSYSTQFLTGDDGVSCWYVVNDSTGERIKISDLQSSSAKAAGHTGSGWRVFAIIMLLIAVALAAFVLFLLRSIRDGRSKSTHGRAVEAADNEDEFADDEDEYYFEDDDDESTGDAQDAFREDEEEIPDIGDDSGQDEPLYEEAEDTAPDGEDSVQEDGGNAQESPVIEHITDAEEIPADENAGFEDEPDDSGSGVYTGEDTETGAYDESAEDTAGEQYAEDDDLVYDESEDYDQDEDYQDEEYQDEDDYADEGAGKKASGKGKGFKHFVRKILGGESKEDSEEQTRDEDQEEDEPVEFDEFKEYPEDIDLLPKEDRKKADDSYAEDVTFEDDEVAGEYNNDRTHLYMQRVMKNVSGDDEEEIPPEEENDGGQSDNPEDDLFDEDDDDMEYSFLGTRHRK